MRTTALLVCALLAACGGDDEGVGVTQAAQPGAPNKPAAPANDKGPKLTPRMHVEDRVACPTPEKATGPECKPDAATCDAGLYCLMTGDKGAGGYHCEPCQERESIRHEFKDRDFLAEQARDPFQSFLLPQAGLGTPGGESKPDLDKTCSRQDQLVASNFGYEDLKLVGIVAQGTQRKALMMDTANVGHIVKRNDCVGKERAIVKDIGTGFVTFVIVSDDGKRPPVERSVPLYPNGLSAVLPTSQPPPVDQPPSAPVIAPPGSQAPVIAPPPSHP
jgi:Tfp pilus assembly protein PilP